MKPTTAHSKIFSPAMMMVGVPLFLSVFLATLTVVTVKIGYTTLSTQFAQLDVAKKNEEVLSEKQSALTALAPQIKGMADSAVRAVPEDSQTLLIFAYIKELASANQVLIADLKAGGGAGDVDNKLANSDISFNASGSFDAVTSFLSKFSDAAPINTVDKIELSTSNQVSTAAVRVKNYWASFPSTIPSVLEPLAGLTSEEEALISKMESLTSPNFPTIIPTGPADRVNPFGF